MINEYVALKKQTFANGNFKLVPIRFQDRLDIMQWRNEQIHHLRQHKRLTIEDQDNYFSNVVTRLFEQSNPTQLLFSFLENDTCIGYGGLVHINWIDKNAEISFIMNTVLEEVQFNKLWSNYLNLIEQVAFGDLKLHKIFTYAFDVRPHLYPMLIDNGYLQDAVLKEHCLYEGNYIDVLIHSKISTLPYLRKATVDDVELTYQWANNKKIRQYSFNQNEIKFEEHHQWFNSKINSPNCYYFIFCLGLQKMGSIRIDVNEESIGLISYLIDPDFQGNGYGKLILEKAEELLLTSYPVIKKLVGKVLAENQASLKIFRKLNYIECENAENFIFEKEIKRII